MLIIAYFTADAIAVERAKIHALAGFDDALLARKAVAVRGAGPGNNRAVILLPGTYGWSLTVMFMRALSLSACI